MITSFFHLSLKFVLIIPSKSPSVSKSSRPRLVSIENMTRLPVPSAQKRDRRNTVIVI